MEQLSVRELRAALEFLREAYRFGDLDEFVARIVKGLPVLIPCEVVAYCEMNPLTNASLNRTDPPGIAPPVINEAWQRHMNEHPVLTHNVRTRDGHAVRFADFLTHREHRKLAVYNEFYRPIGIEDGLCAALDVRLPRVVGLGLHRERWCFGERHKALMDLVRPHLVQAWRNAKSVSRLRAGLRVAGGALERLDRAVVVCSCSGRVRLATVRAVRLLGEYFAWRGGVGSRLPEGLCLWARHQAARVDSPTAMTPRFPHSVTRGGKRLELRLVIEPGHFLLLLDEHVDLIELAPLLRLGLTRREAEVLAWVVQGKTNDDIARVLGISARTVQKHLERVFVKLGVETRTAAARVATETAGGL